LCTIPGVVEAIRGIRRVLRPGGKFIFFEHGLSPDPRVRRWQEWSEPLFHLAFEGCHVTRDIPSSSGRAHSRLSRWTQRISRHSQSRGRIAGGVRRFRNCDSATGWRCSAHSGLDVPPEQINLAHRC
jgi:hypothetical protein